MKRKKTAARNHLECPRISNHELSRKILLTILFIGSTIVGITKGQDLTGTVVNYNENPAVPVPGIEIYFDGTIQDTTNAQGGFGFPTAIERDENPIVPKEFKLKLFPNPFNPSTILEYTVPYKADVKIRAYNVLGQLLYSNTLKDQLTGNYQLKFDADKYKLPSKMLFFQVEIAPANGIISSGKQHLVKTIKGVYLK